MTMDSGSDVRLAQSQHDIQQLKTFLIAPFFLEFNLMVCTELPFAPPRFWISLACDFGLALRIPSPTSTLNFLLFVKTMYD